MNRSFQSFCVAALSSAALVCTFAMAQAPAGAGVTPPKLEPLPEGSDADLEPQVTITRREGDTVEEARVNGKLMWVRVTPAHGRPYFLIPDAGGHTYIRRDSLDTGLKVPLWVLFTF